MDGWYLCFYHYSTVSIPCATFSFFFIYVPVYVISQRLLPDGFISFLFPTVGRIFFGYVSLFHRIYTPCARYFFFIYI